MLDDVGLITEGGAIKIWHLMRSIVMLTMDGVVLQRPTRMNSQVILTTGSPHHVKVIGFFIPYIRYHLCLKHSRYVKDI